MYKKFLKKISNSKILKYFRKLDKYKVSVVLITLISIFIRFYNFSGRWEIGADSTRDAMIALEALKRHQLPLMGPFSSAGPFVTGGVYYWLIMASYLIFPFLINAPWFLTGIISVVGVILFMYLGKILIGKKFSLIIGILAMLSPQYVGIALDLSNPAFVVIFSILTIIFFIKLWQKNKTIFSLLMGLSIGLAINMHYQAINLLIFLPAVFFVPKSSWKNRIGYFLLACFGAFVTYLPMLYWDSHQNFANIRNILDYFLIGQYRIYVPNSWRLFLFKYFPQYWGIDVGGFFIVGLILFIVSGLVFIVSVLRKKVSFLMFFLGIIFLILLFMNKSYRGERSDNYMLYFSPLILIFTSYLIYQFFTFKNKAIKLLGLIVLVIIVLINLVVVKTIMGYTNTMVWEEMIINALNHRYPNGKFSIYDYKYRNYGFSLPLSFLLGTADRIDAKGVKIGVNCYGKDCPNKAHTVLTSPTRIFDLSTVNPAKLIAKKGIWVNVNPSSVYDNQVVWLDQYNLKSTFTFSFEKYIIRKK